MGFSTVEAGRGRVPASAPALPGPRTRRRKTRPGPLGNGAYPRAPPGMSGKKCCERRGKKRTLHHLPCARGCPLPRGPPPSPMPFLLPGRARTVFVQVGASEQGKAARVAFRWARARGSVQTGINAAGQPPDLPAGVPLGGRARTLRSLVRGAHPAPLPLSAPLGISLESVRRVAASNPKTRSRCRTCRFLRIRASR